MRQSLSNAELILSVGQYTRHRLLREQTLQPEQVKLLPNTFNAQAFQISSKPSLLLDRYQIEYQKAIILTVARLDSTERYKGYDQIIKALPQIKAEVPDVHYILVGKGNDKSRIEKLIHDLNLEACVTLTGFIPDEELCDHYNLCDVFAMPSKGEGFGIVYLEALACGKPTLGGNQDGGIDALCQGELGALVDPDNIDEIAHTLIQILQGSYPHPLMYQPQALRQKVIEVYGFQAFQDKLLGLLQTTDLVN
ncbi:glycosyltransferase [Prochlorothrix hollandica]|uniref:glycosyltransferase n=1 Tax=Prochlorothrix hollandica TaxID=1223 RepID=UPI00034B1FAD|nr:glycosyltransferase [Prochlorothrix hollandica]